jgi:hypothetical protein
MDLMLRDRDVDEGISRVSALKEEEFIDVKYEDRYDPVHTSSVPKEDQVNFILKFDLILHKYLLCVLRVFSLVT